jgi:hypothetical protein
VHRELGNGWPVVGCSSISFGVFDVTHIVSRIEAGDRQASAELWPLV